MPRQARRPCRVAVFALESKHACLVRSPHVISAGRAQLSGLGSHVVRSRVPLSDCGGGKQKVWQISRRVAHACIHPSPSPKSPVRVAQSMIRRASRRPERKAPAQAEQRGSQAAGPTPGPFSGADSEPPPTLSRSHCRKRGGPHSKSPPYSTTKTQVVGTWGGLQRPLGWAVRMGRLAQVIFYRGQCRSSAGGWPPRRSRPAHTRYTPSAHPVL